jgi:hypothetical protein
MTFRTALLAAALAAAPLAAHAQSCEAKIGAMGPMSGGAAQWGLAMAGAAELAAAELNAQGGATIDGKKCKIVVVSYDSKYTADGAAAGANALASEGIKIIIGPVGSPEATGIKPVAARNEQLTWNAAYAKNALEPKYPLVFHIAPGPGTRWSSTRSSISPGSNRWPWWRRTTRAAPTSRAWTPSPTATTASRRPRSTTSAARRTSRRS